MADSQLITSSVIYKDVVGFPHYRVGDDGSVWTQKVKGSNYGKLGAWKLLKPLPVSDSGRFKVALRRDGKTYWRMIHHLVLEAFVGPCPPEMEACHGDDNGTNNRLDNLRWDTHLSNCEDRTRNGLAVGKYQKTHGRRMRRVARNDRWQLIRQLRSEGFAYREIAEQLSVDLQTVYRVITRGRGLVGKSQPGIRNATAKLTDDDVKTIRQLRADGMTFAAIAERFSVCRALIQGIVYGRRWKHVS